MSERLGFGQYKHWQINVVPPSYLRWVLKNRPLTSSQRRAICAELGRLKVDKSRPGYPATLHEQRRRLLARCPRARRRHVPA